MSFTKIPSRAWLFLLAFWASQLACGQAPAGRLEASEAGVKAAFLYKFASYVEWPEAALGNAEAPFMVAVIGADEVATELERLQGKAVHGRRVAVRRLKDGDSFAGVQMLFVGRGQSNIRGILRGAQQPGLLVVTELERGLEMGSAINFVIADDRVGFEVSVEAAERNGLRVSSRMLNVARRVVSR